MWHRLFGTLATGSRQGQTREAVLQLIQQRAGKLRGPRRGWQVKAAAWVKRAHVDRGDKKVGLHAAGADGAFHIIEDLRPRYVVPDLAGCELKPYVGHYKAVASSSSSSSTAVAPVGQMAASSAPP